MRGWIPGRSTEDRRDRPLTTDRSSEARNAPLPATRPGVNDVRRLKVVTWLLCLVPFFWLAWRIFDDGLGANPIEELIHWAGRSALVLLLGALAVTPVRRITGFNRLILIRRLVGLFAFSYACLHLLLYAVVDQGLAWSFILEDVAERRYITAGFSAFLALVPLAITSTKGWIRRLGKRWARLHRLVYLAGALAVLHFYWRVKADTLWPLVSAAVLLTLLLPRVWWAYRKRKARRATA